MVAFETYVGMLHPDDREEMLKIVRDAIASKSSYRVAHRIVWPQGSVHWLVSAGGVTLDESGVVTGTVGCSMDVTERVDREVENHRLAVAALEAAEGERRRSRPRRSTDGRASAARRPHTPAESAARGPTDHRRHRVELPHQPRRGTVTRDPQGVVLATLVRYGFLVVPQV